MNIDRVIIAASTVSTIINK